MKVTEITVSAGRVLPHPFQQYSNLRPMITLKAQLDEGEDPDVAARALQAKAEGLVEDHSRYMIRSLEEIEELSRKQREVASLERTIQRAQDDLDRLRKDLPALADLSVKEPRQGHPADEYDDDEGPDSDGDHGDPADRW